MSWIQTATGKSFYLLDPNPDAICIEDISKSLSLINRFNGHTTVAYSVAEHCVRGVYACAFPEAELHFLLHDAAEAYIGDITQPLKAMLYQIRSIETNVLRAIYECFGIPLPSAAILDEVYRVDNVMLATEKRDLMAPEPQPWAPLPEPLERTIVPWDAQGAEQCYLKTWERLYGGAK